MDTYTSKRLCKIILSPSSSPSSVVVPYAPEEEQSHQDVNEGMLIGLTDKFKQGDDSKRRKSQPPNQPSKRALDVIIDRFEKLCMKCHTLLIAEKFFQDKRAESLLQQLNTVQIKHSQILSELSKLDSSGGSPNGGSKCVPEIHGTQAATGSVPVYSEPQASGSQGRASRGYHELAGNITGSSPASLPEIDHESLLRGFGLRKCQGCCCPNHKV